jgi:hypothetical protein
MRGTVLERWFGGGAGLVVSRGDENQPVRSQLGVLASVSDRPLRWSLSSICPVVAAALIALSLALPAHAQLAGTAAATTQFESNSNVFDLNSGVAAPTTDGRRSDTLYSYGAQFEGSYSWRRQQFHANVSATQFEYHRFTGLNHTSYNFGAGMNWLFGPRLDGKLDVVRTRNMVPFYNLTGSLAGSVLQLSLVTEQRETAAIGLLLSPVWRLEGVGYTSKSDQPVFRAPSLQLTQNSGAVALGYQGFAGISSGLSYTYSSGDYTGAQNLVTTGATNASFRQSTAEFFAKKEQGRATLDGKLGYSRRTSDTGNDNSSGLTGLFDVGYELTPKTRVTAKIARTINSYLLNSGSEIDTDAGATVQWQATHKVAFTAGYTFSYRKFPRQGNNPVGSDRFDIQEYASLGANYQPLQWLQIRPYGNVQTRRSTFIGGHYSSTVVGVYLTALIPEKPK